MTVVVRSVLTGAVKSMISDTVGGPSYGRVLADAASMLVLLGFLKFALGEVEIDDDKPANERLLSVDPPETTLARVCSGALPKPPRT